MTLSSWLEDLRRAQVVRPVQDDSRTRWDYPLGVHGERIFSEVIGGGQADFDADWVDADGHTLSRGDRALLYAYFIQKGHLEELSVAMKMLTSQSLGLEDLLVIDLGCGPCTGGLALADALGAGARFEYIGLDRASSMRDLGEQLARAPEAAKHMRAIERTWTASLRECHYGKAPSWRPVLIIASFLLASGSLDPVGLLDEVMKFVDRVGRGPVVLLYTNSPRPDANRSFPAFRDALAKHDFEIICDDRGSEPSDRRERDLRYALFRRQERNILPLGGQ